MRPTRIKSIGVFTWITFCFPVLIYASNCPAPEEIMPCRCRGRKDQIQVWCSHSDLHRVNGALEKLMRIKNMPAIDELIVENNKMPTLPARAFGALQISRLLLRNNGLQSLSRNAFAGLENSLEEIYIVEPDLRKFPYDCVENLQRLEAFTMEQCKIQLLPKFNGLNRLKHVRIDESNIKSFPVGAFAQMASIRQIHVVNAKVDALPNGIFGPLPTLLLANFSSNLINYVEMRSFALLPKLEILSLSNNEIEDAASVGRACQSLPSLKSLDLSENKLEHMKDGSFVNMKSLQILNLSKNRISQVSPRSFANMPSLRKVDISYNGLFSFPAFLFETTPLLEELRMRGNKLTSASELGLILGSLTSLRYLDLASNGLKTFQDIYRYNNYTQLQRLDLSDNEIRELDLATFENFPSLKELNLRNNSMESIIVKSELSLKSLKELDLSENSLRSGPNSVMLSVPKIVRLDLSSNEISIIDRNMFVSNKHLQLLDLSHNVLNSLHYNCFMGLPKLILLDLSENIIDNIPSHSFKELRSLRALNLGNNRLESLSKDIFHDLKNLSHLSLKHNALGTLPSGIFSNLKKLKELNLRNNHLRNLNDRLFSSLISLESLSLASNRINNFETNVFDGMPKLRSLDLSYNGLTDLPADSFKGLASLEKFEIRENRIRTIGDNIFPDTRKMQILDLAYNALPEIPANLVGRNPNLKVIDLSHNQIRQLSVHDFMENPHLVELYLNDNQLEELPSHSFKDLSSLTILDLNGNKVSSLKKETFKNLPKLIYLRLSQNHIKDIDYAAFSDLKSLDGLDLQENDIKEIQAYSFYNTNALKYLNISNNDFDDARNIGFESLLSLEVVDASHNRLRNIDGASLQKLKWLVELRLNDNGICNIPNGLFDGMSRLKMLLMNNNYISRIYESIFFKLRNNIAFIDFSGNPIMCDCEIAWLRSIIVRRKIDEVQQMRCSKPLELKGNVLTAVAANKMTCDKFAKNSSNTNFRMEDCPKLEKSKKLKYQESSTNNKYVEKKPFFVNSKPNLNVPSDFQAGSNDFTPGDTPTIYAGTEKRKDEGIAQSETGTTFSGLSSIFGVPLDFGLNLGVAPSFSFNKKSYSSSKSPYLSKKTEKVESTSRLPQSWIDRPAKASSSQNINNVYEPPKYIPTKPNQPYIPLRSSKTKKRDNNVKGSRNQGQVKFPSGSSSSKLPQSSWHPSYPHTETGFIPIEPFFHQSEGNEGGRKQPKPVVQPDSKQDQYDNSIPSSSGSSFSAPSDYSNANVTPKPTMRTTSRPSTPEIVTQSGTFPSADIYADFKNIRPVDYDENPLKPSGKPKNHQPPYNVAVDSYTPRDGTDNEQSEEEFGLSDFWGMFTGDGNSKNSSKNSVDSVPLDFTNPIDTSSDFSSLTSENTLLRGRGKPTITKITLEERNRNRKVKNNNKLETSITPQQGTGLTRSRNTGIFDLPKRFENEEEKHPDAPPVLIGASSEPLDWYYSNYNNSPNTPIEVIDKLLERGKNDYGRSTDGQLSLLQSGHTSKNSGTYYKSRIDLIGIFLIVLIPVTLS